MRHTRSSRRARPSSLTLLLRPAPPKALAALLFGSGESPRGGPTGASARGARPGEGGRSADRGDGRSPLVTALGLLPRRRRGRTDGARRVPGRGTTPPVPRGLAGGGDLTRRPPCPVRV
ncbi:hypothetical protein THAOC_29740, partial [Thalassiosira oceanica]